MSAGLFFAAFLLASPLRDYNNQWRREALVREIAMPIYEYEHDGPHGECQERFEALQGFHDDPLAECPDCGKPCHRILSTFSAQSGSGNILSNSNLESKGFTKYERTSKGRYKKTFGQGPDGISDK